MSASHTLVLTAKLGDLTDDLVRAVIDRLDPRALGARWLAMGEAWEADLPSTGPAPLAALLDTVRRAIGPAPVDINVISDAGSRRKRLLCADMESTIIEQELIDELATLVGRHEEISAITKAAMRGELDFAASLVRRVALFEGLAADQLNPLLDRVTLMPGAETLVRTMRAHGGKCALISGGFTIFAERIGAQLGFDAVVANVLEIENGKLTGRVREPIVGPQGKADALARLASEYGFDASDTIAVGDGSNDTLMLAAAGLGVAFRAKPILAAHARALPNGAVVTHGDLTALLSLQGYARDSFAS
ncbi:phosphoserine phosphatase SerB [Hyphomicrobium sp. LHD-15]|uniref:phosphoserine phosphatase SerB n=1 Tax=Hyphomicrobium sp. LHD-15 TaxID=3072142 RepID=UPI00280D161A|nr:phosphoserine phosphatase SerB [Hyphomicrobium sp. LHD-15]MDQ8697471.1 phosphoserine phosphatase SerB [Hyphomicrobium sp. LHD-15]